MNSEKKSYASFFMLQKRLSGKKKIAVVRSDKFEALLVAIARDESIPPIKRAFFITMICGALRVSETHDAKKKDFSWEEVNGEKMLILKVNVLKKRKKDSRFCRIHPAVQDFVWEAVQNIVGKYVFNWTRQSSADIVHSFFYDVEGICTHSFRHSAISYLLFEENLSREKTSKLVHVTSKIIDHYAHLDERRVLSTLFSKDSKNEK